MNKIRFNNYTRINKAKARKEFENGNDLFILPCNVRLDSMWFEPVKINRFSWWNGKRTFDNIVNEFEYYNCNNNELGKYTSFYIIGEND